MSGERHASSGNTRVNRERYFGTVFAGVVVLLCLLFGYRIYNELTDMEHFLQVAHGRLLVEMQRQQIVLSRCRDAVGRYVAMEGKIQDHLITLHRLTKTHGKQAKIVENERLEIMKLIEEIDLLIEKYPDLKSKGPYVLLMETIQESGLRVITERLSYNNWTYTYNVKCLVFPEWIVAWVCGFRKQPFLRGPLNYAALGDSLLKEN